MNRLEPFINNYQTYRNYKSQIPTSPQMSQSSSKPIFESVVLQKENILKPKTQSSQFQGPDPALDLQTSHSEILESLSFIQKQFEKGIININKQSDIISLNVQVSGSGQRKPQSYYRFQQKHQKSAENQIQRRKNHKHNLSIQLGQLIHSVEQLKQVQLILQTEILQTFQSNSHILAWFKQQLNLYITQPTKIMNSPQIQKNHKKVYQQKYNQSNDQPNITFIISENERLEEQMFQLRQKIAGIQIDVQERARQIVSKMQKDLLQSFQQKYNNKRSAKQIEQNVDYYLSTIQSLTSQIIFLKQQYNLSQQDRQQRQDYQKFQQYLSSRQQQLTKRQQYLGGRQNQLNFRDKKLRDLQIRISKQYEQLSNEKQRFQEIDLELKEVQTQLNRRTSELEKWERSLQQQQKLLDVKVGQWKRQRQMHFRESGRRQSSHYEQTSQVQRYETDDDQEQRQRPGTGQLRNKPKSALVYPQHLTPNKSQVSSSLLYLSTLHQDRSRVVQEILAKRKALNANPKNSQKNGSLQSIFTQNQFNKLKNRKINKNGAQTFQQKPKFQSHFVRYDMPSQNGVKNKQFYPINSTAQPITHSTLSNKYTPRPSSVISQKPTQNSKNQLINEKLERLKEQIKREVKQLE